MPEDPRIGQLQAIIEDFLHLVSLRFTPEALATSPWKLTVEKAEKLLSDINSERLFGCAK